MLYSYSIFIFKDNPNFITPFIGGIVDMGNPFALHPEG